MIDIEKLNRFVDIASQLPLSVQQESLLNEFITDIEATINHLSDIELQQAELNHEIGKHKYRANILQVYAAMVQTYKNGLDVSRFLNNIDVQKHFDKNPEYYKLFAKSYSYAVKN